LLKEVASMAQILGVVFAFEAAMAAILFGTAGRWDLPWFWAVLGVHAASCLVAVSLIDPDLRKERLRPGPGGRDRMLRLFALPLILAHLIVAGLDAGRFGWSGHLPVAVQAAALMGLGTGMALSVWAVAANRFFSPVVRIQEERGHHLITTGPYRVLRHPGYVGTILGALSGGIALGSWWSLVPMAPLVALLLRRTMVEDRFLHEGLAGYAGYAERVRYRLVPGLW
jgi:protein-S-isoprenylcysteine O-methyltransferase Ste14